MQRPASKLDFTQMLEPTFPYFVISFLVSSNNTFVFSCKVHGKKETVSLFTLLYLTDKLSHHNHLKVYLSPIEI